MMEDLELPEGRENLNSQQEKNHSVVPVRTAARYSLREVTDWCLQLQNSPDTNEA